MSYPNSYSSSCSPIFVDPWPENHQTYLDTKLSDLESMLDDSADSSLHPQEPDSTTTNHPLLYNIRSQKLQVLLYF